MSIAPLCCLR